MSAVFLLAGNRVEKIYLPLLAARPARRFSGIFLCAGLRIKGLRTVYTVLNPFRML